MDADYLASLLREDLPTHDPAWETPGPLAANFQHKDHRFEGESNLSEKLCIYLGENGLGGAVVDSSIEAMSSKRCAPPDVPEEDGGRVPMYAAGAFSSSGTVATTRGRIILSPSYDCYSGEVQGDTYSVEGGELRRRAEAPCSEDARLPPQSIASTSGSFRRRGTSSLSGGSGYTRTTARTTTRMKLHHAASSEFEAAIPEVLRQIQTKYLPGRSLPDFLGGNGSSPYLGPTTDPLQHMFSTVAPPTSPEFSLPSHYWLLARSIYLLRRVHCWSCYAAGGGLLNSGGNSQASSAADDNGPTKKRPGILSLRLRRRTFDRIISSANSSEDPHEPDSESTSFPSEDVKAFEKSLEALHWPNYDAFAARGDGVTEVASDDLSSGSSLNPNCAALSVSQATWVALLAVYVLQRQELRRRCKQHEPLPQIPLCSTLTVLASALAVQNNLNKAVSPTKGINSFSAPSSSTASSRTCGCSGQSGVSIVTKTRVRNQLGRTVSGLHSSASVSVAGSTMSAGIHSSSRATAPPASAKVRTDPPSLPSFSKNPGLLFNAEAQCKHRRPLSSGFGQPKEVLSEPSRPHTATAGRPFGRRQSGSAESCDTKFWKSAQPLESPPQGQQRKQKPAILQVCSKLIADVKSNTQRSLLPLTSRFGSSAAAAASEVQPSVAHERFLSRSMAVYVRDCVTVLEIIQQFCLSLFVGSAWVDEQDPLSTTTLSDFLETAYQVLESFKLCRSPSSRLLISSDSGDGLRRQPKSSASIHSQIGGPGETMGVRSQLKRFAAATASSLYLTVTPSCLQAHGILESVIESHRASAVCALCREGSFDTSSGRFTANRSGDNKRDPCSRIGLARRNFEKKLFQLISSIGYETRIPGSKLALSGHLLIKTIGLCRVRSTPNKAPECTLRPKKQHPGCTSRMTSGSIASLSTVALPPSADGSSEVSIVHVGVGS